MNTFVAVCLWVMFFVFGLLVGLMAFYPKTKELEYQNKTLKEWLEASRKTNEILLKDCEELRIDIERVVNGKNIINIGEDETKMN